MFRSAGIVGGFTMLSRGLGLVRDVLMARFFGTSLMMSAFVVAFTIPNLFRRLFGEGALASSFIPIFIETREREGAAAAWVLARRVLSIATVVFAAIVLLGLGLSWAGSSLDVFNEKWRMIFALSRVMFPYMMFICLAALFMAVLNSLHHFKVPAFTPALLNICWIGTVLLICPLIRDNPEARIYAVAWSVLLAGVLQMLAQVPVMMQLGFEPRFEFVWKDERIHRMLLMMGPAAFGLAVTQLNVVVDRLLAMWVGEAAPAALFYAERLVYFPLGIIATALGTVLLPAFSGFAARGEFEIMRSTAERSLRHLLFIMIPAAVGLGVLAPYIFAAVFEQGEFTATSSRMSAVALQCYAPGLLVFSLAKVVVPAFYSMQDTRTPVRIGLIALGVNVVLNITFILTLPQEYKHAGIALGTVLAEACSSLILLRILQRRIGRIDWRNVGGTFGRASLAGAVMFTVLFYGIPVLSAPIAAWGKLGQVVTLIGGVFVGGLTYFAVICIMRAPELREVLSIIKRK
jgi:putative peptidoglycan lipid II flippase